jgi:hypothetical protein
VKPPAGAGPLGHQRVNCTALIEPGSCDKGVYAASTR